MENQVIELAYALDTFYFLVMGAFVMWMAAGFAMLEGVLTLAMLVRAFHFAPTAQVPVPVAHLTVRSEAGIHLHLTRRADPDTT